MTTSQTDEDALRETAAGAADPGGDGDDGAVRLGHGAAGIALAAAGPARARATPRAPSRSAG